MPNTVVKRTRDGEGWRLKVSTRALFPCGNIGYRLQGGLHFCEVLGIQTNGGIGQACKPRKQTLERVSIAFTANGNGKNTT